MALHYVRAHNDLFRSQNSKFRTQDLTVLTQDFTQDLLFLTWDLTLHFSTKTWDTLLHAKQWLGPTSAGSFFSFLRIHTQQRAEQWELRHIQIKHITQLFYNTPHHTLSPKCCLFVLIMTVSQGVYSVFSSIHQWVMWLINATKTKCRQHHNYLFKCSFIYS